MVVPENIHIPPPPPHYGRDLPYDALPSEFSKITAPKIYSPPLRNFQNLAHPLEICPSLIEVQK